jgi:hypothetical protein
VTAQKSSAVTCQCLPTGLSPQEVPMTVGATEKRKLMVSADVTTCRSKLKTSRSHAIILRGNCTTMTKRMAFPDIHGWCLTLLNQILAFSCFKTFRITPTYSHSTSYAACWKSAPAHTNPVVACFCPHSLHRHAMRSLVAILVSIPMSLAVTADPA